MKHHATVVLGLLLGSSSAAALTFCNQTSTTARCAVGGWDTTSGSYYSMGWFAVPPAKCVDASVSTVQVDAYYCSDESGRTWGGGGPAYCLKDPVGFGIYNARSASSCNRANGRMAAFRTLTSPLVELREELEEHSTYHPVIHGDQAPPL